jgi:hypothetical protein
MCKCILIISQIIGFLVTCCCAASDYMGKDLAHGTAVVFFQVQEVTDPITGEGDPARGLLSVVEKGGKPGSVLIAHKDMHHHANNESQDALEERKARIADDDTDSRRYIPIAFKSVCYYCDIDTA